MDADAITAIWGAVTGTLALGWTVLVGLRSRAILHVTSGFTVEAHDPNLLRLRLTLTNQGREAVTVMVAGYIFEESKPVSLSDGTPADFHPEMR